MFPGLGGINPAQMQSMMKQLGIKTEQINAKRVIFETSDGLMIITDPQITKMTMQGVETYQVVGKTSFEEYSNNDKQGVVSDDDVLMVAQQSNVSKEKAKQVLEKNNGDIAKTILELKH